MDNTGDHPYSKKNWEKTVVFMVWAVTRMHSLDQTVLPIWLLFPVNICSFADKAVLDFSAGLPYGP